MGFFSGLTLALIILKLLGVIKISWLAVFLPFVTVYLVAILIICMTE